MTKQMESTYLQIEKDFEFFGITDNMTWKEIKARMREIKKQFDERWNNRTYNDIRITFTRLWQYAPLRLLKGNEIKVFISLACFAKQPGRVLISMSMMQEMMDLSEGTIRNAVKSLQAQGFLIKEKSSNPKDNNKPTAYTLNPEIMAACKINLQEYRIKQFKNQMDTKTECIYMQLCETAKKYIAEPIKDAEGVIVCHEVKRASEIPKQTAPPHPEPPQPRNLSRLYTTPPTKSKSLHLLKSMKIYPLIVLPLRKINNFKERCKNSCKARWIFQTYPE